MNRCAATSMSPVPQTFAAARISFFATTKVGYVYKFSCSIDRIEAAQVFITNPAIAKGDAGAWERQTSQEEAAVRLVRQWPRNRRCQVLVIRCCARWSRSGPGAPIGVDFT